MAARSLPLIASVISEAEAVEMAQPLPSKRTSSTRSPSSFSDSVEAVAAQRVVAVRARVGLLELAEVTRPLVVIEDHVAVEIFQLHQPNTSRTLGSAATSLSTSPRVL